MSTAEDILADYFDNDIEFLEELFTVFSKDSGAYFEKIETALKDQNCPDLEKIAHTLKGSASNFQAKTIVTLAGELESIGRGGAITDDASDKAQALKAELEKFNSEMHLFIEEKKS